MYQHAVNANYSFISFIFVVVVTYLLLVKTITSRIPMIVVNQDCILHYFMGKLAHFLLKINNNTSKYVDPAMTKY